MNFATSDGTATTAGFHNAVAADDGVVCRGDIATKPSTAPIDGDGRSEPDRNRRRRTSVATPAASPGQSAGLLHHECNDDGRDSLQFSAAAYSVTNSGPTATIRSVRGDGSAGAVTVNFATSDGAATPAASDYTAVTTTAGFAAAPTATKPSRFRLTTTPGGGDETINLTLSSRPAARLWAVRPPPVPTIVDNDAPGCCSSVRRPTA